MKIRLFQLSALLLAPVLLLGTGYIPTAQSADQSPLETELATLRKQYKLPGLALLVFDTQGTLAQATVGHRLRGKKALLSPQDSFQLGSCTKAMTATLLAMLVEEGKLRWNSTLGEVFPEYKAQMQGDWAQISLINLLSNRSGAPENLDSDGLWRQLWQRKGSPQEQRLQLLRGVIKHPPLFPAGSQYLYSNAGFALAGAMAEKVTGQDWESLMTQRIFQPLGMASAGFGPPGKLHNLSQPWGHNREGKAIPPDLNADNPAAIGPAATVHASLPDWAKFARIHLVGEKQGWVINGRKQLSAAAFKKLHTPLGDSYALGWIATERAWAGGTALTHSGTNTFFFVVNWLSLSKGRGVLVATNQGGDSASQALDKAAWAAIQQYIEPFNP
jgi:CubicO group peptidase (beta-lactamase class C family)